MLTRRRVLIADDHPGIVRAMSRLLSLHHDVVGSVGNCSGLLEAVETLQPDIIVLDVKLTDGDSLTTCRRITQRNPAVKVMVFTARDDPDVRRRALESGASVFVHKLGEVDGLISAVEQLRDTRE